MSLLEQGWWNGLVERLRLEPLGVLAREVGVPIDQLCEALASVGANGPAHLAPWWPEARRLLKNTPVREVARRFHTNPRRVRRAAARTGQRAGGREVGTRGLLDLLPYREQLGRVADWRIARAAGVSVEAVQGERRRHRIPAFRPAPGHKAGSLSADEEAWILGPVKPRRERVRSDAGKVNIVRRPGQRSEDDSEPRTLETRESRVETRAPKVARRLATPEARRIGRAPVPDSFFNEREKKNLDELLAPRRNRDGRKRIVRVDEPVARAVEPEAAARKVRGKKEIGWRKVDESVVAALEKAAASAPPPPPAPTRDVKPRAVKPAAPVVRPTAPARPAAPVRTVVAPVVTAPVAPVVAPKVEVRTAGRWRVEAAGLVLVFSAVDLLDAAGQLQRLLPPEQLRTASLHRL